MTPHLHAVIVSYKRRALTEQTLASFLATVSVPYTLVIVDNGSPIEVTAWLHTLDVPTIFLPENRYPGYATNRGWERMPAQTTLLMRSDNDSLWLPGWCDEMLEAFDDPTVGQYGPVAAGDEAWTCMPVWPVGGNSVIRRSLYDRGVRYSELPWSATTTEDSRLTHDVWALGYRRVFGTRPGLAYLDDGDEDYRTETAAARERPASRSTAYDQP